MRDPQGKENCLVTWSVKESATNFHKQRCLILPSEFASCTQDVSTAAECM